MLTISAVNGVGFKKRHAFDCTEEVEAMEDEGSRKEIRSPLRVVSDGSLPLRSNNKNMA